LQRELRTEAIILRMVPYGDRKNILTLFSKDAGLLSAVSYISLKKKGFLSPLCRCDFLFLKKNSELYQLKEAAPMDLYSDLRSDFKKLNCAGFWLGTLLRSQLPSKPSPMLYKLLICYLDELKENPHVESLKMSFLLKLVKHEGLYSPNNLPPQVQLLAESRHFAELTNLPLTPELEARIEKYFWRVIDIS